MSDNPEYLMIWHVFSLVNWINGILPYNVRARVCVCIYVLDLIFIESRGNIEII
jgi:hypothetical protein